MRIKKSFVSVVRRLLHTPTISLVVAASVLLLQVASFVVPFPAHAALVVSAPLTGSFSTGTSKTAAFDAGTGTGRVLVVLIATDDTVHQATSVTYGGQAMSGGTVATFPLYSTESMQLYYLANPASGSNNVVITVSGVDNYAYVIASVSGADPSAPIGAVGAGAYSLSSTPYATITPQKSGSLIVAGFGVDAAATFAPYNGSTEIGETSATGISGALYSQSSVSTAQTSVSSNTGASFTYWSASAIEIKAAPPAPTVSLVVGNSSGKEPNNISGIGGASGYMTLSRTGATTAALDVAYSLTTSSATYTADYAADPTAGTCTNETSTGATIPAGLASCTAYFKPVADSTVESTETMDAVLSSGGSAYTVGTNKEALMYISDNTTPITQCSDSIDNDADGLVDLADPGCVNAADNDETDPVAQQGTYTITSPGFATMSLYDDDIPPPGSISGFSVSPLRVRSGQTATLSWTISGMTGCSIDNGMGAVSAADGVHTATTPAVSTRVTFTLTCTNGATPFVRAVSVGIIPSFIEQ